ncbi:MAG: DAK2 domain fusion protein YloV [Verrucomicrobiales bacterium]|jgi:DAK2 domain fusion protein YloV
MLGGWPEAGSVSGLRLPTSNLCAVMTSAFDADQFRSMIVAFRDALVTHKAVINALNVYPVPDGDTGTNMSLTLESVVADLPDAGASMEDVCKAVSHGSLMGARGNSGVIMSQILRGLSAGMKEHDKVDGATFSAALTDAATAAYGAVGNPVEGTILTVVREAAEAAAAADTSTILSVMNAARDGAAEALEKTPQLLPVLAEAGVVDSGGTGLLLFFDAALQVLDGRDVPAPVMPEGAAIPAMAADRPDDHTQSALADLRYEVMFFLDAPDDSIEKFKAAWDDIGDSIVVVGGDGIWNCHVHTDDIGAAIECGIAVGRPHKIRVTDLLEEVEEQEWVKQAAAVAAGGIVAPCATAVVAVSVGAGVADIFRSFGVQHVVAGGQTMNPSTAELLAAVESLPADGVVILPNNKNIIPVAEQVDAQSSKNVSVVPTRSIVGGMAALVSYDPEADLDANVDAMAEALEHLVQGEVTKAVRDTTAEGFEITDGDWLGLAQGKIVAVQADALAAAARVVDALATDEHEIITVVVGEDASEAEASALVAQIAMSHPDLEVEVHSGGQPLYPFIIGVE